MSPPPVTTHDADWLACLVLVIRAHKQELPALYEVGGIDDATTETVRLGVQEEQAFALNVELVRDIDDAGGFPVTEVQRIGIGLTGGDGPAVDLADTRGGTADRIELPQRGFFATGAAESPITAISWIGMPSSSAFACKAGANNCTFSI